MLTADSTAEVQQRLQHVERRLAELHREQAKLEGQRDTLIRKLTDLEGASDSRFVPVR